MFKFIKFVATFLGLCVMIGVTVALITSPTKETGQAVASSGTAEVIQVSADKLYLDYKANEISADNQYRGKVLRVTGAIQAIRKDFSDTPIIELWTTNQFESVNASFQSEAGLAHMVVGRHIAVKCLGNNVVMGMPQLKNCILD